MKRVNLKAKRSNTEYHNKLPVKTLRVNGGTNSSSSVNKE